MKDLTLDKVASEFARRKLAAARLKKLVGPTTYKELANAEGATDNAVYLALRDGVSLSHTRGVPRKGPPRDELLKSIAVTMAPLSNSALAGRLEEYAARLRAAGD